MKALKTIAATAAIATASIAAPVQAEERYMYMGEIFEFAGDFCPRNTLPTDGRMLVVEQYRPLFQILGTKYGGGSISIGRTPIKFGLPKMTVTSDNGAHSEMSGPKARDSVAREAESSEVLYKPRNRSHHHVN